MSQVVRMLAGNVKTFANPKIINATRHFSSARKFFRFVLFNTIQFIGILWMNTPYLLTLINL